MTGYGAVDGEGQLATGAQITWRWEIKSVNARGLDVRFRMPFILDGLEPELRRRAAPLKRGSLNANFSIEFEAPQRGMQLDKAALADVMRAAREIEQCTEYAPPRIDGLLALKGVMVQTETPLDAEDMKALRGFCLDGFTQAMACFEQTRFSEGAHLATALGQQLQTLKKLVDAVRAKSSALLKAHADHLKMQVATVLGDTALEPARLEQELAIIAVKADISEELDRLDGHIIAANDHILTGDIVGRALDFLAQELMREANTLTTKVPDLATKQQGLAMKGVIDQFKEQVQNLA